MFICSVHYELRVLANTLFIIHVMNFMVCMIFSLFFVLPTGRAVIIISTTPTKSKYARENTKYRSFHMEMWFVFSVNKYKFNYHAPWCCTATQKAIHINDGMKTMSTRSIGRWKINSRSNAVVNGEVCTGESASYLTQAVGADSPTGRAIICCHRVHCIRI